MRLAFPRRDRLPWSRPASRCFVKAILPGAVLTRVAASHVRVGTFQYFAARGDEEAIRELLDYVIARHYPSARDAECPALAVFKAGRRASGRAHRRLDAGRLHSWRDEHRQHGDFRRDDRLWSLRIHGRIRSKHGIQLHRSWRALCVREPACHRAVESGAIRRNAAAAHRSGCRQGDRYSRRKSCSPSSRRSTRDSSRHCVARSGSHRSRTATSSSSSVCWPAMQEAQADFTLTFRRLADAATESRRASRTA